MNNELAENCLEDQPRTGGRDSLPVHPRGDSPGGVRAGGGRAFRRHRFQRGHVPLRAGAGAGKRAGRHHAVQNLQRGHAARQPGGGRPVGRSHGRRADQRPGGRLFRPISRRLAASTGQQVRPRADDGALRPERGLSAHWWPAPATRASCCWATAPSSATWPRPSIRWAISTRRNSTNWPRIWACPNRFWRKEPTGDLWVGQTDESELGFSYAEVDRLLVLMVDRRWHRAELVAGRLRRRVRRSRGRR